MLGDTAATGSEPRAERVYAFGRAFERVDDDRMLAFGFDQRPLAGQGAGDDRAIGGEPMPMRIKRDDRNLINRLSQGARQ